MVKPENYAGRDIINTVKLGILENARPTRYPAWGIKFNFDGNQLEREWTHHNVERFFEDIKFQATGRVLYLERLPEEIPEDLEGHIRCIIELDGDCENRKLWRKRTNRLHELAKNSDRGEFSIEKLRTYLEEMESEELVVYNSMQGFGFVPINGSDLNKIQTREEEWGTAIDLESEGRYVHESSGGYNLVGLNIHNEDNPQISQLYHNGQLIGIYVETGTSNPSQGAFPVEGYRKAGTEKSVLIHPDAIDRFFTF